MKVINFKNLTKEKIKRELNELLNKDRFVCIEDSLESLKNIEKNLNKISSEFIENDTLQTLKKELKKAFKKISDKENKAMEEHFFNLFNFLDYLSKENHDTKMKWDRKFGSFMTFEGYFKDEFYKFSKTINGINVISWYNSTRNNKIGVLKFKNLENDIKTIRKYYLSDITELEFNSIYKKYLSKR